MNKIALLFPGQASQYIGMGKEMYDKSDIAKVIFNEANEVLGFDIKKLCFEGDMKELTKTENAQPAILTVSYIAYNLYLDIVGRMPAFAVGHSLGEYSALLCSEVLSFSDVLQIVRKRGQFMMEAASEGVGSMAAISGLDEEVIHSICKDISTPDEVVVISNYNSPLRTVISGHKTAMEKVTLKLKEMKGNVIPLKVSGPFHSPLMKPAADKLKNELMKYKYNDFKYPVISNVSAKPYESLESIILNLTEQLVKPVYWSDSMKYLEEQNVSLAIELGPKSVLKDIMSKNTKNIKVYSSDLSEDIKSYKEEITNNKSKYISKYNIISKCMSMAACTRNINWNNDEYNHGVIESYRKMQLIQDEIEKKNLEPTSSQIRETLELLRIIFNTKRVPMEVQVEKINQILDEANMRESFEDFI